MALPDVSISHYRTLHHGAPDLYDRRPSRRGKPRGEVVADDASDSRERRVADLRQQVQEAERLGRLERVPALRDAIKRLGTMPSRVAVVKSEASPAEHRDLFLVHAGAGKYVISALFGQPDRRLDRVVQAWFDSDAIGTEDFDRYRT